MARQSGKNAAMYIFLTGVSAWVWIADLYDYVIEVRTITFPARIKGDRWDRRVPSHGEGKLTARRYVQAASVLAPLAINSIPTLAANVFAPGVRFDWAVMGVDSGFPTAGAPAHYDASLFSAQGTGYVDQGHQGAPRAQLEDDFAIVIDTMGHMG